MLWLFLLVIFQICCKRNKWLIKGILNHVVAWKWLCDYSLDKDTLWGYVRLKYSRKHQQLYSIFICLDPVILGQYGCQAAFSRVCDTIFITCYNLLLAAMMRTRPEITLLPHTFIVSLVESYQFKNILKSNNINDLIDSKCKNERPEDTLSGFWQSTTTIDFPKGTII